MVDGAVIILVVAVTDDETESEWDETGTGDFPWYFTSIKGAGWLFNEIWSMFIEGKTNRLFSSLDDIGWKLLM